MKQACSLAAFFILLCGLMAAQERGPGILIPPPPITLDPWVLHSKLEQQITPDYSAKTRSWNLEGDVIIKVLVDQAGNVESTTWIVTPDAPATLAFAALQAIRQWKYQPTLVDGNPRPVSSWVAVRFRLSATPNVEILTRSENSTPQIDHERLNIARKLRISSGVAESNLVQSVEPIYPREALDNRIQGDVLLQVVIGKPDGAITQIHPVSGHPLLVLASLNALRQWKYKPYLLNGEPVDVETTITIKFHL